MAAGYRLALRDRVLHWGATPDEAREPLAGDELLPAPDGVSTRAITVNAPAEAVWPWLAQMGPAPRGGAYTYDWIENLLGLNMHSAAVVLEEYQDPKVGDEIGFGANTMRLELVDAPRALAWRATHGGWVWSFTVRESGGSTRLISRNLFRLDRALDKVGMELMIPGSLVMEDKMLRGIKLRAERLAAEQIT